MRLKSETEGQQIVNGMTANTNDHAGGYSYIYSRTLQSEMYNCTTCKCGSTGLTTLHVYML